MDPLKIGKLRYRAGDYDGALIAFTDVSLRSHDVKLIFYAFYSYI